MKLLSRLVLVIALTATTVAAQTKVTPPKNKYTPQQDVQIGREAAGEVRQQYPMISDSQIRGYLERLGERLVDAAPPELNHEVFEYLVYAGQSEGHQRLRVARRTHVRQSRHDRGRAG